MVVGIDISTGTPPSMLQMSKLFLKADVRDAAKDLADAFASAGLDLKDKVRNPLLSFRPKLTTAHIARTPAEGHAGARGARKI